MRGKIHTTYRYALQIIFLLLFSKTYAQQVIYLKNPSLDPETPGSSIIADKWDSRPPYPVVGPDFSRDASIPASEGRYFIELYNLYGRNTYSTPPDQIEFWAHSIGQQLEETLVAGRTYSLSFDLKTSTSDPYPNLNRPFYGSMVIMGSSAKGAPEERLYASGRFYHADWQQYVAVFTPATDINYIRITSVSVEKDTANVVTDIDNLSPISETMDLVITTGKSCPGQATGFARVTIPDPVEAYTYLWMPGNYTTNEVNGLAAGVYHLTVKGASGSSASRDVKVEAYDITVTQNVTGISCYGKTDGAVTLTASGGQSPYTYKLAGEAATTFGSFANMAAGTYTITVADQQCAIDVVVDMQEPTPLTLENLQTRNVTCNGASDGQIILTATGGTMPYTYAAQPAAAQSDSIIGKLDAGTYQYIITDSHDCVISGEAVITKESKACAVFVPTAFSPNGDGKNDVFRIKLQDDISDYHLSVYGRWGQLVYDSSDPSSSWNGKYKDAMLPAGSYVWTITYTDSKNQPIKQQGTLVLIL
jgi:gliding motility-associated-like protein